MNVRRGIEHNDRIYLWPVLKKGLWLGAWAAIVPNAVWGFGLVGLSLALVAIGHFLSGSGMEELWSDAIVLVVPGLLACLPFVFTIIPALGAGGLNAMILYLVWRRRQLKGSIGLISGTALGVLWGSIVIGILWYFDQDSQFRVVDEVAVAITVSVAALVGCWHGWRMTRYLQRQAKPEQDTEPG